jgi:general secretion pathway protein J
MSPRAAKPRAWSSPRTGIGSPRASLSGAAIVSPRLVLRSSRARGFTLIEILVALLILGIMSALGYETYRAGRISAERAEESMKRSREIEFGMRMLVMDFAQMVPRPVRDPLGQSRLPCLHGFAGNGTTANVNTLFAGGGQPLGSDSKMHFNSDPGFQSSFGGSSSNTTVPLADLTRAGWSNTAGQQRSTLQRVSYALVGDKLERSYTTALDIVQGTQPQVQDLFTQVKTVQLRYLDGNLTWQNLWPPASLPLPDSLWTRPLAVEVTIEFKDWGTVRRLIEVAG